MELGANLSILIDDVALLKDYVLEDELDGEPGRNFGGVDHAGRVLRFFFFRLRIFESV